MNTKNLPAKLLAILAVLFCASIVCASISRVPALDPVRYVEADATATAIAPFVYREEQYNEIVLPEKLATEADEIVATTQNAYHWQRVTDQAAGIAKVAAWVSFALMCAGVGIGVGAWFGARGVREVRQAALVPTRHLLEGPHITPWGVTHTATLATARLDVPRDALPEHARMITATYDATQPPLLAELAGALANGTATRAQMAQARYLLEERNTR